LPADRVFGALADGTRRAILELLRDSQPLTAGDIAARFTRISRPAVSKHLRVLRDARLVTAEERGREVHYSLDARPLRELQQEWLDAFAPHWEESLRRLKRESEREVSVGRGRPRARP
jgi:DNA-binding transcriptional ArsR family regulator